MEESPQSATLETANPDPSTVEAQYAVDVRPASLGGDQVLELWKGSLGKIEEHRAKYAWYYERHLVAPPTMFFLRSAANAAPVGVASVGCRQMRVAGRDVSAGLMADVVVAPSYRSLYPAIFLLRQVRQQGSTQFDLLYGFPNKKAAPVFSRVGYRRIGQMVRYARVVRCKQYLSRHVSTWISAIGAPLIDRTRLLFDWLRKPHTHEADNKWLDQPDQCFDVFWAKFAESSYMMGQRNNAYLTWRFFRQSWHQYKLFVLTTNNKQDLMAYAVCEVEAETLYVRDFLAQPSTRRSTTVTLLRELYSQAYRMGLKSVCLEFCGANDVHDDIKSAGMVQRGNRPVFASVPKDMLLSGDDWFLTSADEDQ